MMSGTLLRLADLGADIHYMHLASGSCGSMTLPADEIAAIRETEAKGAAKLLGATYHESLVPDLEVYYTDELIRRLAAIVRRVAPDFLLAPSPIDYMEDHQNTARLAVTAAFTRGIPNFVTIPPVEPMANDVAVYHAMPYGLEGPVGEQIRPEFVINITGLDERRRELLVCHKSQRDWLDASQGVDSYVDAMMSMSSDVATRAGKSGHAEGWRRRMHLGFCHSGYRPLEAMLSDFVRTSIQNPK